MTNALGMDTANIAQGTMAIARAMAKRRDIPLRQYIDKLILEDAAREELRTGEVVEPVWALPVGRPRKVR